MKSQNNWNCSKKEIEMTAIFALCTFVCVVMTMMGLVSKVEVEEKYDRMYARILHGEYKEGKITFDKYEELLKAFGVEPYRIDEIPGMPGYSNLNGDIENKA